MEKNNSTTTKRYKVPKSIEVREEIWLRAKSVAAFQGITLSQYVERALKWSLEDPESPGREKKNAAL